MVEPEKQHFPEQILVKFKHFAAQLAEWDRDIVEVIAVKTAEKEDQLGKIDLVCTFDPEPLGDSHGYLRLVNLLLRNDYEKVSQQLGIKEPFDLGFVMGGEVYLSYGKSPDSLEDGLILWSSDNRPKKL